MKQLYDITPPDELVREWCAWCNEIETAEHFWQRIATQAAQWGSDRELEACCEWFICDWTDIETADKLRIARRPKPPSLKEQALEALQSALEPDTRVMTVLDPNQHALIRRALEALDD